MAKLLTGELQTVLSAANYKRKTTKIKNDNARIAPLLSHLVPVAEALGIDFNKTGWTFKVSSPPDGMKKVYQPAVGTYQGKVCLQWGNTFTPLSDLTVPVSYVLDGKRVMVVIEIGDDFYPFDSYVREGVNIDEIMLRTAVKKGKLADYIDDIRIIPDSLADLTPNVEYLVTGYTVGSYNGKPTYALMIAGQGAYSANSILINRLQDDPIITEDKPAKLTIGEVKATTSSGFPIVPIIQFSIFAESELEGYTFD